jgi:farnesyl diphosphate synthase
LGAIAAGCQDQKQLTALEQYGGYIGLAYQIQDDILDIVGNTETLGKTKGKDRTKQKATFPTLMGITAAQQYAQELHEKALLSIKFLDSRGQHLASLSKFFIERVF